MYEIVWESPTMTAVTRCHHISRDPIVSSCVSTFQSAQKHTRDYNKTYVANDVTLTLWHITSLRVFNRLLIHAEMKL